MTTSRTQFLRLLAMMLACIVGVGACGSSKPTSSSTNPTTSEVHSPESESTIAGQALRDQLAGRTFVLANPDGTFPARVLQPAVTLTLVLAGDGTQSRNFINGNVACNSVVYSGSLDGDHLVITGSATTFAGCPDQGLPRLSPFYEPLDARLALSDDGSTVTVTASNTGKVTHLLLDPVRFPVAQGASLVGTYQLTPKRLLVLDDNGTGRVIEAVSQVMTCPITWTPPPSLSISGADCPADEELRSQFGPQLTATGELRKRGSWLFVGSLAFAKTTPPAPAPASDPLANWPARPSRTFTMADVPVLLPADRSGRFTVSEGDFTLANPPPPSGDHFAQYLVNVNDPSDLVVVDTSLGNVSFDGLGDPIVVKGWRGAWSGDRAVTLLSESGRVVVTGSTARQQVGLLTRRATGAGWDLPGYSPMFEGWRYVSKARSILIDADDFKASIRTTVGGPEVQLFELIGPKLKRIDVKEYRASSIESIGTWDVTWSPAPDVIVTVSYSVPGSNFDYDAFEALRPAAEAFAQSVLPATPEELEALVAR